jgi:nicotinate-nucleotide adenylyltransferase
MIGIFGGTFDPIHHGHLRVALELYQQLGLDEVRFIPCRQPPHRSMPQASDAQRLTMLQLALAGQSGFVIDQRELRREGPSYMVDTLASIRAEVGDVPVCLIVGADAFAKLSGWHHWMHLIELAHIVVAHRPGNAFLLEDELLTLYQRCQIDDPDELARAPAGHILRCQVTQLDISSVKIREELANGRSARYLLPEDVWAYIQEQGLYQNH